MRRLCRAVAARCGRDPVLAVREDQVSQNPPEKLERRLGLVIWNLVPALVDPREAEVAVLSRLAVLRPVDHEGRVPSRGELGLVREVQRERDDFAAEPVADVVLIDVCVSGFLATCGGGGTLKRAGEGQGGGPRYRGGKT